MQKAGVAGRNMVTMTWLFALIVLGTKLLLIADYGNPTPSWDQWDAEASRLYVPWLRHSLDWQQMVAPFNEHRLFATRVLDLFLLEANNRVWNAQLQMVADALLHVLALSFLFYHLMKCCPEPRRHWFFAAATLLICTPFGCENLLWGFQSQFYFLLLFSFLYIGGVSLLQPLSWRWWLALACGPLSVLALAGGVLTLASGALIVGGRWLLHDRRRVLPPLLAISLFVLALLAYHATPYTSLSNVYRAHSPEQFLDALNRVMSWPFLPWTVLVIYFPLGRFMVTQLRKPPAEGDPSWFLFGISLWMLGQFVGIAFGRAVIVLFSRYQDLLVVGLLLNVLCLLIQYRARPGPGLRSRYRFFMLWCAAVGLGIALEVPDMQHSISYRGASGLAQEQNLRAWLAAAPGTELIGQPGWDIPYPATAQLQLYLETPEIRAILPGNILPSNQQRQPWLTTALLAQLQWLGLLCLLAALGLLLRTRQALREAA